MRDLPISYGNSCRARFWSNKMTTWEEICGRLGNTIRTTEKVAEYWRMRKSDREAAKDRGGFVAGHTRYKVLRKLGYEECDVIVADSLTEEQKKKYRLYDNKTAEFAPWNQKKLAEELSDVDFMGYDFSQPEPPEGSKEGGEKRMKTCPCCGEVFEA